MDELGKTAFEAFHRFGDGMDLPTDCWPLLKRREQLQWNATAEAVVKEALRRIQLYQLEHLFSAD